MHVRLLEEASPGNPSKRTNIRNKLRASETALKGDFAEYCFFFVSYPVVGAGFAARFVIVLPWEESRELRCAACPPTSVPKDSDAH